MRTVQFLDLTLWNLGPLEKSPDTPGNGVGWSFAGPSSQRTHFLFTLVTPPLMNTGPFCRSTEQPFIFPHSLFTLLLTILSPQTHKLFLSVCVCVQFLINTHTHTHCPVTVLTSLSHMCCHFLLVI